MAVSTNSNLEEISLEEFKSFVLNPHHPCMMAKSVVSSGNLDFHIYEEFGTKKTAEQMVKDIKNYVDDYNFLDNEFFSFIAAFPNDNFVSEIEFENRLWLQLQFLHEKDIRAWDPRVSPDPESPQFSFSVAGRAFYIIGMHPKASRIARRAPFPLLVFNLHWQFEKLREMGVYQKVKNRIRKKGEKLQGSINPVLADFGEDSEAKQYSGRNVGAGWKCPFHPKE